MTVSSSNARVEYAGDDVTDDFTGTFRILDETHIKVVLVDTSGDGTEQTLTTDYTVAGVGNATFTVTMLTPPATGERLILQRDMPFKQETDYVDADPFPAQAHEDALDERVMETQQLLLLANRSFRLGDDVSSGFAIDLPVPIATYFLRVNDAADGLEWFDIGDATLSIPADLSVTTGKIADDAVTYAKIQNVSVTDVVLGRSTAGAGNVEEIPCTAAGRAILDDANAAAQLTTLGAAASGSVTASGITMATARILGRTTAAAGAVEEITAGADMSLSGGGLTLASGAFVQHAVSYTAVEKILTTVTPFDTTTPQNTEGEEITTVTITPKFATGHLLVKANVCLLLSTTSGVSGVIHIHRDLTADAIAAVPVNISSSAGGDLAQQMTTSLFCRVASAGVATTFKLRAGKSVHPGATMTINPSATSLGGYQITSLEVYEIKDF